MGKILVLLLSCLPVLLSTEQPLGLTATPRPRSAALPVGNLHVLWPQLPVLLRRRSFAPPTFLRFLEWPPENSILI